MPYKAPVAAKPSKQIFDPFNSSATGHQRAENRLGGSTSWRDSRSLKLREQFSAGSGGGKRMNDTVGAGSLDFGQDGRTENGGWERGAKGLRTGGQQSIWESMKVKKEEESERPAKRVKTESLTSKPSTIVSPFTPYKKQDGTIRETTWTSHELSPSDLLEPLYTPEKPDESASVMVKQEQDSTPFATAADNSTNAAVEEDEVAKKPAAPQIFTNLTIYLNGCTAPLSDHKLKHLISTHGGNMSISLGRRTVTHVTLGKINANGGAGGGLAGSKIQKEIATLRGKSVKFVTAEWIVDSIKAGKRLPESRYEAMKLAPKGVANISTIFKPTAKS
ncbi:hypothetical protein CKM354_001160500 [Cercospora kikuchii]|uniref:BRCT domain-containing protein n=1 Tax=Cercospora kikuchii TaxID=84275 RepID=A0A9P3CTE4_9PEZI|nr:uncharacterized protein CKM354_001160500 [Cercospora kikuchii]GIZ48551.1 hypothetical protein CKM354_001160500 [Cercospora kikuchii]